MLLQVLHLLRRYLGEYVHGLSAEALRISVWKGLYLETFIQIEYFKLLEAFSKALKDF